MIRYSIILISYVSINDCYYLLSTTLMISSNAYRVSNINVDILEQSEIGSSNPKVQASQIEKSSITYFLQSYLHQLMGRKEKPMQEKNLCCRELGRSLGFKFAEVISEGSFERFLSPKESKDGKDTKPVKYVHEVKFLCEKVWGELFNRKVDKLQFAAATNTFTFQDNSFRLIQHISHPVY